MVDKDEYFRQLYALKEVSDDEDDGLPVTTPILKHVNSTVPPEADQSSYNSKLPRLLHSTSAPPTSSPELVVVRDTPVLSREKPVSGTTPLQGGVSFIAETPLGQQMFKSRPEFARRTRSDPNQLSDLSAMAPSGSNLGKRKRNEKPIVMVPEPQRCLAGKVIFWIPNNDITVARRTRINNAQMYGARWTNDYAIDIDKIDFIVVDMEFTYQDVIQFLGPLGLPERIKIVNIHFPAHCIQFKKLLNPDQKQYKVKGDQPPQVLPIVEKQLSIEDPDRNHSLQLKPPQSKPGRWDYIPPRATPPRSDSSTQRSKSAQPSVSSFHSSPGVWIAPTKNFESIAVNSTENLRVDTTKLQKANSGDELDQTIKEVQELSHLPLDDDELEDIHASTADDSENNTGGSPSMRLVRLRKQPTTRGHFNQDNFSCMRGGVGDNSATNPNHPTIAILQEMADYYTRISDTWRPMAYRKVINILGQQSRKIATKEDALALPFIGDRLAEKIEEIVTTKHLRRLESALDEPEDHTFQLFTDIYGVGKNQASKWVSQGYKTLQDLLDNVPLPTNQRIGIEHYDDFLTRIPRNEVTALGSIVIKAASVIDAAVEVIIGGSYRRGAKDSGDIDFIITKPKTTRSQELLPFLNKLVKYLTESGFLVAPLAVPHSDSGTTWQGCCILPSMIPPNQPREIWRRIDFLLVPSSEMGAALIYFTGNDMFNRSIRLLASKKGMRLNQRGLYKDVMRGPGRAKITEGELVEGRDERKIFEILGVPWRRPEERIC